MTEYINKSFMLALSYRLTVAVNVSEYELETVNWKSSWNDDMFACVQLWQEYLRSCISNDDAVGNTIFKAINAIVKRLSQGYENIIEDALPQDHQDVHVYQCLLDDLHNIAHNPAFSEWELSEFFIFGQQLAQNDLRPYFSIINKPELQVIVSAWPKFMPLSKKSFPRSWPGWPTAPTLNDCLAQYAATRQRFSGTASFSFGSLVNLVLSIMCPFQFPTTAWCWQDWEGRQPWHLLLAGAYFMTPLHIVVDDQNDKAFATLFEIMKRDKKEGRETNDCGWIVRNELWPDKNSNNTRSKAWDKMTKDTLPSLGEFEYEGGRGRKTSGRCRLPAVFAKSNCRIFVEKAKIS